MKKYLIQLGHVLEVILLWLWTTIGDLVEAALSALEKKRGYSAEFGNESDIASRFNKGFTVTRNGKLTRKLSYQNMLIVGPTGCGKTTKLLVKTMFALKNCSIISNSPSGELRELTSGYKSSDHVIKTLNFSDANISSRFNLLMRITSSSHAHKIAEIIASAQKGQVGGDPFWFKQSIAFIAICIQILLKQEEKYRNMANLVDIVNRFASSPRAVDILVVKSGDKRLLSEYKAFVAYPEKTRQNIVASVKSDLRIFTDDEVAEVTSADSIDFEELRKTPTMLYIQTSVGESRYYSTLTAIFFEQLYAYLLSKLPEKDDLDVFFILDEASSLYIPLLPLALANLRKYRCGTVVCTQSPNQLKTMYGNEFQNIVTNCQTKVYLAGQTDPEVLHHLETLGGKYVSTDDKGVDRVTNLISSDEVRLLPQNRSLIVSGNNPIIKGRVSPYFESPTLRRYASIPPAPYDVENHVPISYLLEDMSNEAKEKNKEQKTA